MTEAAPLRQRPRGIPWGFSLICGGCGGIVGWVDDEETRQTAWDNHTRACIRQRGRNFDNRSPGRSKQTIIWENPIPEVGDVPPKGWRLVEGEWIAPESQQNQGGKANNDRNGQVEAPKVETPVTPQEGVSPEQVAQIVAQVLQATNPAGGSTPAETVSVEESSSSKEEDGIPSTKAGLKRFLIERINAQGHASDGAYEEYARWLLGDDRFHGKYPGKVRTADGMVEMYLLKIADRGDGAQAFGLTTGDARKIEAALVQAEFRSLIVGPSGGQ